MDKYAEKTSETTATRSSTRDDASRSAETPRRSRLSRLLGRIRDAYAAHEKRLIELRVYDRSR